jgi:hypothetical protein
MNIKEIITEAVDRELLKQLNNSQLFSKQGDSYVFIWTNKTLRTLLRNPAFKSAQDSDLGTVSTPGSAHGIGIIHIPTNSICVGAIDNDYTALWTSSEDVNDFFRKVKSPKIRSLLNRLEDLAMDLEAYNDAGGEEDTGSKITSKGVQRILDTINADDSDYSAIPQEYLDIEDMSVEEARKHLESALKVLKKTAATNQKQIDVLLSIFRNSSSTKEKKTEIAKKLNDFPTYDSEIESLQDFLRNEKQLFTDIEDTESEQSDTSDTDMEELENTLYEWARNFERDFPDLDVSPFEFDPNQ